MQLLIFISLADLSAEAIIYASPTKIANEWMKYQREYNIHFNGPPSSEQLFTNSPSYYHCLYASQSPNAVMYFEGFSEFLRNTSHHNTVQPQFIELADSVIRKMSIQYKSEEIRKRAFRHVLTGTGLFSLSDYSSRAVSKGDVKSDLSVIFESPNSNLNAVITNIELKNDFGEGGKNLNRQQTGYYLHFSEAFLMEKNLRHDLAPMLLISIVGCSYMQAFGGYRNERNEPCIDAISSPLSLMYSCSDQFRNVELVACFFQAAYNVIEALKSYYRITLEKSYIPRGGWPYFNYNNAVDYREHHLKNGGVFFAQYKSQEVVVKFVYNRYGTEVHRCLEQKQLAPKILALEELPCSWIVVMMEHVPLPPIEMQDISKLPLNVRQEGAKAILDALKEGNYVHGDLRKPNLIYNATTEKIVVLDYDLAGVEGSVTYPYGLNTRDIDWPEGVYGGVEVTTEHDRYMIYKELDIPDF